MSAKTLLFDSVRGQLTTLSALFSFSHEVLMFWTNSLTSCGTFPPMAAAFSTAFTQAQSRDDLLNIPWSINSPEQFTQGKGLPQSTTSSLTFISFPIECTNRTSLTARPANPSIVSIIRVWDGKFGFESIDMVFAWKVKRERERKREE